MKLINLSDGQHALQNGSMTYMRKNGSQHTTKTPCKEKANGSNINKPSWKQIQIY